MIMLRIHNSRSLGAFVIPTGTDLYRYHTKRRLRKTGTSSTKASFSIHVESFSLELTSVVFTDEMVLVKPSFGITMTKIL